MGDMGSYRMTHFVDESPVVGAPKLHRISPSGHMPGKLWFRSGKIKHHCTEGLCAQKASVEWGASKIRRTAHPTGHLHIISSTASPTLWIDALPVVYCTSRHNQPVFLYYIDRRRRLTIFGSSPNTISQDVSPYTPAARHFHFLHPRVSP